MAVALLQEPMGCMNFISRTVSREYYTLDEPIAPSKKVWSSSGWEHQVWRSCQIGLAAISPNVLPISILKGSSCKRFVTAPPHLSLAYSTPSKAAALGLLRAPATEYCTGRKLGVAGAQRSDVTSLYIRRANDFFEIPPVVKNLREWPWQPWHQASGQWRGWDDDPAARSTSEHTRLLAVKDRSLSTRILPIGSITAKPTSVLARKYRLGR